jgi:hypothetical protein
MQGRRARTERSNWLAVHLAIARKLASMAQPFAETRMGTGAGGCNGLQNFTSFHHRFI